MRLMSCAVAAILMMGSGCGGGGEATPTTPTPTPPAVATVTVSPSTLSLLPTQTAPLTAETRSGSGAVLAGRAITWESSTPSVATVSAIGVVTAVTAGTTTVTATSEGRAGVVQVTVSPAPVATVEIAPSSATLEVGATTTLSVTLKAADQSVLTGRTVTWSSATPTVASVANGVVTAISPGTAVITASSEQRAANITVTVVPIPVASVTLTPTQATIVVGATASLSASTRSANGTVLTGRTVTWSSSNATVATVANGVVTGIATGSATITAASEGRSATATVTVQPIPVASVALTPSTTTLSIGATVTLNAATRDANGATLTGRTISWSTSNAAVATVANGLVTAVSPGSAVITATSESQSGTAQITVSTPTPSYSRSVAPGSTHVCALTLAGAAWCWGAGGPGMLGNGTNTAAQLTPVAVNGGHMFQSLTSGHLHSCGLTTIGAAWCWGEGVNGVLGNGATTNQSSPVAVSGSLAFTKISSAYGTTMCGLTAAGAAYCWGSNFAGSVGTGTAGGTRTTPTLVTGGHVFTDIAVGNETVCGVRVDAAVLCWGSNVFGQLGNGTVGISVASPTLVSGGHQFVEVGGGNGHMCARKANGSVWCWGRNNSGQLGDGTTVDRSTPVLVVGGHTFASIGIGWNFTCARTGAGAGWCWGNAGSGVLGNGSTASSSTPVAVSGGHTFNEIIGASNVTCGRTSAGVFCWGFNGSGRLGDGTTVSRNVPTAVVGLP